MKKRNPKKWLGGSVLLATLGAIGFSACSTDELDPWVLASSELVQDEGRHQFDYSGGSFTLGLKANTDWTVATPNWIEVDKASGTGDGTLTFSVLENRTSNKRNGSIVITARENSQTTVAGTSQQSYNVSQTSLLDYFANQAAISDISYTKEITRHVGSYVYCDHTLTFTISSPLSDDEISQYVKSGWLSINGRYTYFDPVSFTMKNGTVTLEFSDDDYHYLNYTANLTFRFSDNQDRSYDFVNGVFEDVPITVIDLTD